MVRTAHSFRCLGQRVSKYDRSGSAGAAQRRPVARAATRPGHPATPGWRVGRWRVPPRHRHRIPLARPLLAVAAEVPLLNEHDPRARAAKMGPEAERAGPQLDRHVTRRHRRQGRKDDESGGGLVNVDGNSLWAHRCLGRRPSRPRPRVASAHSCSPLYGTSHAGGAGSRARVADHRLVRATHQVGPGQEWCVGRVPRSVGRGEPLPSFGPCLAGDLHHLSPWRLD